MGMFGPSYGNMQPAKVAETPDFIGAARTQTMNNISNNQLKQKQQMEMLRGGAEIGGKVWDKYDKYKAANPDGSMGKWAKGGWDNVTSGFGAGSAAAPTSAAAGLGNTMGPAQMAATQGGLGASSTATGAGIANAAGPGAFTLGGAEAASAAALAGDGALAGGAAAGAGGGGAMGALASNPVGWAALAALAAWSFMDKRES